MVFSSQEKNPFKSPKIIAQNKALKVQAGTKKSKAG
jgi:hypothetical protein